MDVENYYINYRKIIEEIEESEKHLDSFTQIRYNLHTKINNSKEDSQINDKIRRINKLIHECEFSYLERIEKLIVLKEKYIEQLETIKNVRYRKVAYLKYADSYTWEKISEITGYSLRNLHYIDKKLKKEYNIK